MSDAHSLSYRHSDERNVVTVGGGGERGRKRIAEPNG
jgi:hypothetical protein